MLLLPKYDSYGQCKRSSVFCLDLSPASPSSRKLSWSRSTRGLHTCAKTGSLLKISKQRQPNVNWWWKLHRVPLLPNPSFWFSALSCHFIIYAIPIILVRLTNLQNPVSRKKTNFCGPLEDVYSKDLKRSGTLTIIWSVSKAEFWEHMRKCIISI